jgi:diguanylate cyclase (GGDEF)-like protein/PAS domain S-box-containing protein
MTERPATEPAQDAGRADELSRLIAALHETEQRIAVLTRGEVDAVVSREGQTYLLRQAQQQLREDDSARNADILDALPANVALLDADGLILAVNNAWRVYADENGYAAGGDGLATNYLAVCNRAHGPDQASARMAAAGIRAVVAGTVPTYAQAYPCHSPGRLQWFQLLVTPLEGMRPGGVVVMHVDITSQQLAEGESAELQRRFADLMKNMGLASVMLDTQGRITFCNDHLLRLTGWTSEDTIGNDWFEQFIPSTEPEIKVNFERLLASGGGDGVELGKYENRILTRTGDTRLISWSNSLQRSPSGLVIGTASIGEDITERRLAEIRLTHLSRVHAMLSGISSLIVRVNDRDTLHQEACRIAVRDGGFLMAMLVLVDTQSGAMRVAASAGKDDGMVAEVNRILASATLAPASLTATVIRERRVVVANDCSTDNRLTHADSYRQRGVKSLAVFPLLVAEQAVGAFVLYSAEIGFFVGDELTLLTELTNDIAFAIDHIEKSERLAYLAFYDPLTGLPNAQLFQDQLDRYIDAAQRDGEGVCVIVLDLDGFTEINRTLGRQVGDGLLRAVAARLLRDLTAPFALARTAEDTFAVAGPSQSTFASDHLRDAALGVLHDVFDVQGQAIRISGQSGIAQFPDDGEDARMVMLNAESALKRAKASRQSYIYSSHALNALAASRQALEGDLRDALADNQFRVHYQPRIDMGRGEMVGAEALIRWQHPSRGLLAPAEFIELAEETGLILQIGTWMLQAVCVQQAAWIAAGVQAVPVAVNVSAVQFERGDLLQVVRKALQKSGLEPRMLHIELTETAVLHESEAAAEVLHAVRALGVELALDDFGTGYSSLASLKRYPFSMVKIDGSFITRITSNAEDATITGAIIAMAHGLRLRVIAEGVETLGQFNYLRSRNCDEMQGYLFSRPVTADVFEQMLRVGKRLTLPDLAAESRQTLLLVDDERSILSALTRSLRQDGYRILSAGSGEDALELLALNAVQVIISDQRMPAMSGTEFLRRVARLYPATVRILLSGYTDLKVVTEGVNQGAVFQFITKPWDDDMLRQKVRDAFRRQSAEAGTILETKGPISDADQAATDSGARI